MAKLTYEDKKEIVRLYNDEHYGYLAIANIFNVKHIKISILSIAEELSLSNKILLRLLVKQYYSLVNILVNWRKLLS